MADQNKVRPILDVDPKTDLTRKRSYCHIFVVKSIAYYINPFFYVIFSILYFYFYIVDRGGQVPQQAFLITLFTCTGCS